MPVVFCGALLNSSLKESFRMTFDVAYVQHQIERQLRGSGKSKWQGSLTGDVVICRKKTEKDPLNWGRGSDGSFSTGGSFEEIRVELERSVEWPEAARVEFEHTLRSRRAQQERRINSTRCTTPCRFLLWSAVNYSERHK
jgi:hypothetical protein